MGKRKMKSSSPMGPKPKGVPSPDFNNGMTSIPKISKKPVVPKSKKKYGPGRD